MNRHLYVMLMENKKALDFAVIKKHVEYLKELESSEKLVLCGPFTDYDGGMVVFDTSSKEEAHKLAQGDPYILEGYKTFELRTLEWANKDNNYLID